jgi:hypothetical protein
MEEGVDFLQKKRGKGECAQSRELLSAVEGKERFPFGRRKRDGILDLMSGTQALAVVEEVGGGILAAGAVGGDREKPLVFEEFEIEAGEQRRRILKAGDLFVVGFMEEEKGGCGFARHLRGENGIGQGSGCL